MPDLSWKPGPPMQDAEGWFACATKQGGQYCCFSYRGLFWRENPIPPHLPVPLDIDLWEATAFHLPIPSPPSGETE